jgi:DNA-binding transcriptional MerR regulator
VVNTAAGSREASRPAMSIGAVLAVLRQEFEDVTISKIRFLEDQGLIEPERTASGYRKFSTDDVERLRFVLRAQRDSYLPLRVIRDRLEAAEMPARLVPAVPDGDHGVPAREQRLTRRQLLEAARVEERLLAELESYAVVTPHPGSDLYDAESVAVVMAAAGLAAYGIEARHLRVLRSAAEREAGLVEQVVAPLRRQRSSEAASRADEVAREVTTLCVRLHAALVASALERGAG